MVTVLFSQRAPQVHCPPPRTWREWLQGAVVDRLPTFSRRYRWQAALVLALIAVYRISDVVMGIMANPFYVDMGYTKAEVAAVTKIYGVVMTLLGAFVGGVLAMRWGVMRVLMLGAVLSAGSNLLFAWLAGHGARRDGADCRGGQADNLAGGIASAAFIAYLSSLTNVQYSATQYALFSSMMLLAAQVGGRVFGRTLWMPMATRSSLSAPPCWACRCWCWCGWHPRSKQPLTLDIKAQAAIFFIAIDTTTEPGFYGSFTQATSALHAPRARSGELAPHRTH